MHIAVTTGHGGGSAGAGCSCSPTGRGAGTRDPQCHWGHSRRELAGDRQLVAPLDAPVLLPLHARDGPGGLLGGDFVPVGRKRLGLSSVKGAGRRPSGHHGPWVQQRGKGERVSRLGGHNLQKENTTQR